MLKETAAKGTKAMRFRSPRKALMCSRGQARKGSPGSGGIGEQEQVHHFGATIVPVIVSIQS